MADRVISLSGGQISSEKRNERKTAAQELIW